MRMKTQKAPRFPVELFASRTALRNVRLDSSHQTIIVAILDNKIAMIKKNCNLCLSTRPILLQSRLDRIRFIQRYRRLRNSRSIWYSGTRNATAITTSIMDNNQPGSIEARDSTPEQRLIIEVGETVAVQVPAGMIRDQIRGWVWNQWNRNAPYQIRKDHGAA